MSICFWLDSEAFWDVNHYCKGFFDACAQFGAEICVFSAKNDFGDHRFEIFFQKNIFLPIFTKSWSVFFWGGANIFWGLKYVYWGYFKGYAKFGAEIRIFSTLNWT